MRLRYRRQYQFARGYLEPSSSIQSGNITQVTLHVLGEDHAGSLVGQSITMHCSVQIAMRSQRSTLDPI